MGKLVDKLKKSKVKIAPPVEWEMDCSILLHQNIPKPLHGVAPRVVLGEKWWRQVSQAAYKSTDYHCKACGVAKHLAAYHQWLEAHEVYEIDYAKGKMVYVEAVPLCHFCHNYIHSGRLEMLLQKGKIHHAKYVAIITHGDAVLKLAGLVKPEPYVGKCAEWANWRMVVEGVEHPPLYKTELEWTIAFKD